MSRISIGHGFDLHRFGGSKPLYLGGVLIDESKCIRAHSDGDVVLHALIDAILGASALGDIGEIFPDTVPSTENMSSVDMLKKVLDFARQKAGLRILNVDLTIIMDSPKLSDKKMRIRDNIAFLLDMRPCYISVKAKTTEGLYPEAVACHCVCLCQREVM